MPTTGVSAKGSRAPGIRLRVQRNNLNDHFLVTPNDLFRGTGDYACLSPHERIYLGTGLSYSDGYETTRDALDACVPDLGRDKREAIRRRLREEGFLSLSRVSDGSTFIWVFEFHMFPLPVEERDELVAKKAKADKKPFPGKSLVSPDPAPSGHGVTCGNAECESCSVALDTQGLGSQGDVYKEEKNHSLEEEPPPPTPTTVADGSDDERAAGAEVTELEQQVTACVDQVAADRPEWSKRRVVGAVREALAEGRDPAIVLAAMKLVAADPLTRVPGRLNEEGDWWSRAARVVLRSAAAPAAPMVWCDKHNVRHPESGECRLCAEEASNDAHGASEGAAGVSEIDPKALALMPAGVRARLARLGAGASS